MKFYYMTKTKGKAGSANTAMRVTEAESKAEVKKAKKSDRTSVKGVWTASELVEVWGAENAQKFIAEAKPW